ncbi:MAG: hypothetical protein GX868_14160 [Actinobacteria bacterium]|nr:hypothetical protein [Actinomycetota bacterium]
MATAARLAAFAAALVLVFVLAFTVGRVAVPDGAAARWAERVEANSHHAPSTDSNHDAGHGTGVGK